jgi:hypothetical protein
MSDTPVFTETAIAEKALDSFIIIHTRRWIEQFVVALNLCPFAAPVLRAGQLHIEVCDRAEQAELVAAVCAEFDRLQHSAESEIATSVLVFSCALGDFEDYLDFLALAEDLLWQSGLEGIVQIASFHPRYRFAGTNGDDIANFTNRSPYPMLHFIREEAVSRALERYPSPEQIPERNIEKLQALGSAAVHELLERIKS